MLLPRAYVYSIKKVLCLSLCSCPEQPSLALDFLSVSESCFNSVQLEMPYVCPSGLVRVLSETPPPFLTPPEVRPPSRLSKYPSSLPPKKKKKSLQPSPPSPAPNYTPTLQFDEWPPPLPQSHPVTNKPSALTCLACILEICGRV